jgi:large subunit ribosomal protein L29
MKTEDIRELTDRELRQKLEDDRQELFNLRFQIETRKIKNHQRIPIVKRDIARVNTILRERELMRLYGGEDIAPQDETEEAAPTAAETPRRRGLFRRGK